MQDEGNVTCILGMHRSGTSLVTQLLNRCGLELGPTEQLFGPTEGNPQGHFEHLGFLRVDDSILSHFGGSAARPPVLKPGWENDPSLDPIISEARSLLRSFQESPKWGWKDPRTSILVPFWKKLIGRLRFVICIRNPLEVAESLAKRDGIPIETGLYLWRVYVMAAIRDTIDYPRIFIFYDDLFRYFDREIGRLVSFSGLNMPESPDFRAGVSQGLRHHSRSILDLLHEQRVVPETKLIYLGLRALSNEAFEQTSSLSGTENVKSESLGSFVGVIQQFHDQESTALLQTRLSERELMLDQLVEEREALRSALARMESTLTWQLMGSLNSLKERLLPIRSHRRGVYERLLSRLKNC